MHRITTALLLACGVAAASPIPVTSPTSFHQPGAARARCSPPPSWDGVVGVHVIRDFAMIVGCPDTANGWQYTRALLAYDKHGTWCWVLGDLLLIQEDGPVLNFRFAPVYPLDYPAEGWTFEADGAGNRLLWRIFFNDEGNWHWWLGGADYCSSISSACAGAVLPWDLSRPLPTANACDPWW